MEFPEWQGCTELQRCFLKKKVPEHKVPWDWLQVLADVARVPPSFCILNHAANISCHVCDAKQSIFRLGSVFTLTFKHAFLCKVITATKKTHCCEIHSKLELTVLKTTLHMMLGLYDKSSCSQPQIQTPLDSILPFSHLSPSQKAAKIWG